MNILHVISGNDNGGGGKHVLNICRNNIKNMNCSIICIGDGSLYDKALYNNIDVSKSTFRKLLLGELSRILNLKKIDIINFHGAKSNFLYFLIGWKIKVPCVVTVHSDYRYDFLNNSFKRYFYTPLSVIGLKKFKNYICVSHYIEDILEKNNFKGHKYIVNNGEDFSAVEPLISRNSIRKKFSIDVNDFVYVMVARMHPVKNHKKLIRAFYLLQSQFNNIKLILVGNGELEQKLKNIVKNFGIEGKVIFAGFRNNPLDFINASDISILTSLNEGGEPPLVVLESALLRKPVICSNIGNMNSIINNKNGYLVNPKDENDISFKMKEAYLNRNNLYIMGQNLYKDMLNKFSLQRFWNNYYNAYLNILNGVK